MYKMRCCWNLLAAALLLSSVTSGLKPPRSYYRRSYYSSVGPPGSVRLVSPASGPPSYRQADLQINESKRRDVTKKYPKKTHYRPYSAEEDDFSSERYSGEYSGETPQDSREYTIGTQIRVQHPISVPKKASSSSTYSKPHKYPSSPPYKSSSRPVYAADSNEDHAPEPPSSKRSKWQAASYESDADPFHLVPPPKATAASSHAYRVFEPDHDEYEVPTRPKSHDRYKSVASKKQIEAFLEDQQKLLDEAIKLQLINNPKLQNFLKHDSHETRPELDIEDFETFPPNFAGPGPQHNSFIVEHPPVSPPKGRSRRRPPGIELKRSPKPKHIIKPKRKYRPSALVINV